MGEFLARAADDGARLDSFVAERCNVSRAVAARMIQAGDVLVDGEVPAKSMRVHAAMRIVVRAPDAPPPPPAAEPIDLRVVFEDDALMVVSKPAGVVVHPAPGHDTGTMVETLVARGARGGEPERPGIVHRLDQGTSGLMIVARSEEAFERLSAAMAAREVSRIYLAMTEGVPGTDTLTIDAPIGRSPKQRKKMAVVAGGRDAVTDVTVLERLGGCAFVEVRPRTGRTHQIRVHLEAAGHAVAGDAVYGHDKKLARALGLERPFLHAARLAFAHPITGARVELEDHLPQDLEEALERARTF